MQLEDKQLRCADCAQEFTFSAGEQQFFALRQLVNEPKRCANCRLKMRFSRSGRDVSVLTDVRCADCEKQVKVPFRPRGHKPVYCNDCLVNHKVVDQPRQPQLATSSSGA
jgi:CxxC-x17-CxxC domain-containing protein